MKRTIGLAVGVVVLAATQAAGQVIDVPTLSREGVTRVLDAAEQEARRNGWNVSIAVVDPAGMLLGFIRMDQAPSASVELSIGKAHTSAKFRRSSKTMEDVATARPGFAALAGMTLVEGGVPVIVRDRVVAAVGVSGVTSAQDAQVAEAGAKAVAVDR